MKKRNLKKRIHVNQHKIRQNLKNGDYQPVITVKTYKDNIYGHSVEIHGDSTVGYSPNKPLACGARLWIETESPVDIVDDLDGKVYSII